MKSQRRRARERKSDSEGVKSRRSRQQSLSGGRSAEGGEKFRGKGVALEGDNREKHLVIS
jgi:hypothetical protein